MWIKTKEKDALYCVAGIRMKRLVSERCFALEGIVGSEETAVILGEYQTLEEAQAKFKAFEEFLCAGEGKVFCL
ncbi:MAG: hypothetical protein IJ512_00170 [Ruminococcus sp.]|nr:hypothetical protein [Ruminococcus sp.]